MKANEKLAKLEQQKRDIERKIAELKVQASAEERKRDTRKKLLVGALMLQQVDEGKYSKQQLMMLLDDFLVRDNDRELFDLPIKVQP